MTQPPATMPNPYGGEVREQHFALGADADEKRFGGLVGRIPQDGAT